MRSRVRLITATCSIALLAGVLAPSIASAATVGYLPQATLADTQGVNGRVRATAVVGDNVWVAGAFTGVTNGNGTQVIKSSPGLAVLSRTTGQLSATATVPRLTGSGVEVWDLDTDGVRVYAAGKFAYDNTTKKFLISFDGLTGGQVQTYPAAQQLKSVDLADELDSRCRISISHARER